MKKEKYIFRRFVAGLIDYLIVLSITAFYIYEFGEHNSKGEYSVNGLKAIPVFIFWFLYFCIVETTLGSTLGNYILKLKPVDLDTDKRISLKQSFLRHTVDLIDMFFFGIVAIIIITNSKESQRLGDLLARTKVVRT